MKSALLSFLLLSFVIPSFSQSIVGSTSPTVGVSYLYTFDDGTNYASAQWNPTGGSVVSSQVNGTTYSVQISWNVTGNQSLGFYDGFFAISSINVLVSACAAPIAASPTTVTGSSFMANWGIVNCASSYQMDVSTNTSFSSFVSGYNNVSVSGVSVAVTGLSPSTTYYYRVRSVSGSAISVNSNTMNVLTTPAAPTAVSASLVTQTSFRANWNAVIGATSYQLDVSLSNSFSSFLSGFNNLGVSATNYSVTGLSAGVIYYYRVRAVNSSGISVSSNMVTVATLPSAPVCTAPTGISQNAATTSWNSVIGATEYQLELSLNNSFAPILQTFTGILPNIYSLLLTGLSSNTTYYYRVRAHNVSGGSPNSNIITFLTLPNPPLATDATGITSNSFKANWNSVSGIINYRIDVATDPSFINIVSGYANMLTTSLFYNVVGLGQKTNYYYRVRAENSSGASQNSNVISNVNLDANYIKSIMVNKAGVSLDSELASLNLQEKAESISFFDDFGRPIQNVSKQQSPSQQDLIEPISYDLLGREVIKYLPYSTGSDGWIKLDFIPADNPSYNSTGSPHYSFYNSTSDKIADDTRPFSETVFEASPLNRPLQGFGPGQAWKDNNKAVTHGYLVNIDGTAAGQERIIAWDVDTNGLPVKSTTTNASLSAGYYLTGQLNVKSTKDEHGNEVREYVDKEGHTILKKVQVFSGTPQTNNDSHWAQT
ncbi:MAG: fibronectin type III domain-containing protein, partial [Bacteroidetes bacterium]|nr:fibronectin type III domain-containing protein [Bacteroidota bacterium]